MALSGNIEIFPLPEVLRLLARSGKNGCLRIEAPGLDGRIYVKEGALSLATVTSDLEFADQVASSGVVDRSRVGGRDTVDLPEAVAAGRTSEELSDFIREHVVEALYRIRRPGSGTFEFLVDADSRFRTGQSFDAEQIVVEADRRAADWADIEQTISDMHLPVRMVRQLQEPEVTVNAPTWRVLASLEGGSSVAEIARLLGTTEFRAAREVASLMRASLIEPAAAAPTPPAPPPSIDSWFTEPAADGADTAVDGGQAAAATDSDGPAEEEPFTSPWATTVPSTPIEEPTTDPWSRPEPAPDASDAPSTDTESAEADRGSGGWWAEAMTSTDEGGELNTDDFLESVFSDTEGQTGDAEEESGFSMGLLRRRRMGPVSRDVVDD